MINAVGLSNSLLCTELKEVKRNYFREILAQKGNVLCTWSAKYVYMLVGHPKVRLFLVLYHQQYHVGVCIHGIKHIRQTKRVYVVCITVTHSTTRRRQRQHKIHR